MTTCCPIVELRQYTLYPGRRDALVSLFDREFVETQEAVGMRVIGQFRDLNDPNRFVWFRGFADMPARKQALTAFYGGPVWNAHRDAANATMYDSDNVLLLRPARDGAGFAVSDAQRVAPGSESASSAFVVATTYHFAHAVTDEFTRWFGEAVRPVFARHGARVLAELVSEHSENTFPRLPVREGENVFVWVAQFDNRAAYDRYLDSLATDARWSGELFAQLYKQLSGFPETIMLAPTARSLVGR